MQQGRSAVSKCWISPTAIDQLRSQNGLTAMKEMSIAELQQDAGNGRVILDVRAPGEFRAGHIPGAVHIPLGRIREASTKINKNSEIVVHCQGGVRSPIALSVLRKLGFSKVTNLTGGFGDYQRRGLPVETGGLMV